MEFWVQYIQKKKMTNNSAIEKLFNNQSLLSQALTHKSWLNEHPGVRQSNERMEFLGDAILEFIVSKEIYSKFPNNQEGYLTALRSNLVNTDNLYNLALKLEIGRALFLSKGEEDGGGRGNKSLLADTVEAIIGALFLDQGILVVEKFIKKNILTDISIKISGHLKDAKSRLQELVQAQDLPTPKYSVVLESGPDHNKIFKVAVAVDNQTLATASGKSKSEAEQAAAQAALIKWLLK